MHEPASARPLHLAAALAAVLFAPAVTLAQPAGTNDAPPVVTESMANLAIGLTDCDIVQLDLLGDLTGSMRVLVPYQGGFLDLALNPHSVRGDGYRILVHEDGGVTRFAEPGPVLTKRGAVVNRAGSLVAAGASENGLDALMILDAATTLWLEPLKTYFPEVDASFHVLYRDEDKFCSSGSACGTDESLRITDAGSRSGAGNKSVCNGNYLAELACEADWEYRQAKGSVSAVESAINTIINAVNVQYDRDVDIIHNIVFINVWNTSSDPYSGNDPVTSLEQFRDYWNANMGAVARDVAHKFTGKSWSGSGGVIGIAYLGAVCNSSGYGVVRNISGSGCRSDLSAHELGHNWGANHCTCPGFTMNPSLTCANQFSSTSINSITTFVKNIATCAECDVPIVCQTDMGGAGPGNAELSLCGGDMSSGQLSELKLTGTGTVFQLGALLYGFGYQQTPFKGGFLGPFPPQVGVVFTTALNGTWKMNVSGGGGPLTVYLQAVYNNASLQPAGVGISNTLMVQVLP